MSEGYGWCNIDGHDKERGGVKTSKNENKISTKLDRRMLGGLAKWREWIRCRW